MLSRDNIRCQKWVQFSQLEMDKNYIVSQTDVLVRTTLRQNSVLGCALSNMIYTETFVLPKDATIIGFADHLADIIISLKTI